MPTPRPLIDWRDSAKAVPSREGDYLVTVVTRAGRRFTDLARWTGSAWQDAIGHEAANVVAWAELPEPHQA